MSEPVILMVAGSVYAFVFNVWVTWCYEGYLHSKYPKNNIPIMPGMYKPGDAVPVLVGPSNYTAPKYSITMALGLSSVVLFVSGIIVLFQEVLGR